MPTYSYVCIKCEHALDVQHSIHDESLKVCPECKGELKKVFGKVGIAFKGSGFYSTDNAAPKTD